MLTFKTMKTLAHQYYAFFEAFLHPELNRQGSKVHFFTSVLLSWPFVIVGSLLHLAISVVLLKSLIHDRQFWVSVTDFDNKFLMYLSVLLIFFSLVSILFFPLKSFCWSFLWRFILQIYQRITGTFAMDPTLGQDITAAGMGANLFGVIPIFGTVVRELTQFICLFRGIKARLNINGFATLCILMTPYFLLGLFISMISLAIFVVFLFQFSD